MRKGTPVLTTKYPFPITKYAYKYRPRKCACQAWQKADREWQSLPDIDKWEWNHSVKASGMSGYDLWMKERLTVYNKGKGGTRFPSPSGGFTNKKVLEGYYTLPPDACVFDNATQLCLDQARGKAIYWYNYNMTVGQRQAWEKDAAPGRFTGLGLYVWECQYCYAQGFAGPMLPTSQGGRKYPDPCANPWTVPPAG